MLFLYGLFIYLGVNLKQLPISPIGLLLNVALIVLLGVNFYFLVKFWISWTFLMTLQNLFWLCNFNNNSAIITALVANYALQYIKKTDGAIYK